MMQELNRPNNRFALRRARTRTMRPSPRAANNEPGLAGLLPGGVRVRSSAAVVTSVAMVSVVLTAVPPLGVSVAGEKAQVAWVGRPEQLKLICWLNPPVGVTVSTVVPLAPCVTVKVEGLKPRVNEGTVIVSGTAAETEGA